MRRTPWPQQRDLLDLAQESSVSLPSRTSQELVQLLRELLTELTNEPHPIASPTQEVKQP